MAQRSRNTEISILGLFLVLSFFGVVSISVSGKSTSVILSMSRFIVPKELIITKYFDTIWVTDVLNIYSLYRNYFSHPFACACFFFCLLVLHYFIVTYALKRMIHLHEAEWLKCMEKDAYLVNYLVKLVTLHLSK